MSGNRGSTPFSAYATGDSGSEEELDFSRFILSRSFRGRAGILSLPNLLLRVELRVLTFRTSISVTGSAVASMVDSSSESVTITELVSVTGGSSTPGHHFPGLSILSVCP